MRFRNLRIAFSATCLIACALLIVLWVRSYWWFDGVKVFHAPKRMAQLKSFGAGLHLYIGHYSGSDSGFRTFSVPVTPAVWAIPRGPSFHWEPLPECRLSVPIWCVLIIFGSISTIPWLRWRFSVRTLLIATTLIAVVLGLIVWLRR
jgi:hypothetical protein